MTRRWKPIKNAPRDGVEIELRGVAGPYGISKWYGRGRWGVPKNFHKDSGGWMHKDALLRLAGYNPTHWRNIQT